MPRVRKRTLRGLTRHGRQPRLLGRQRPTAAISYADGSSFPTQVLARAVPSRPASRRRVEGSARRYTSFVELPTRAGYQARDQISGGFLNNLASKEDPKHFYAFDGGAFPNVPLIQPRLNSVEEWRFVNHNNDEHPIHVHVNDFQVTSIRSHDRPADRSRQVFIDTLTPAPTMLTDETVRRHPRSAPGSTRLLATCIAIASTTRTMVYGAHQIHIAVSSMRWRFQAPGKPPRSAYTVTATVRRHVIPPVLKAVNVAMGDVDGDGVMT
jgi:hypothetical protein